MSSCTLLDTDLASNSILNTFPCSIGCLQGEWEAFLDKANRIPSSDHPRNRNLLHDCYDIWLNIPPAACVKGIVKAVLRTLL